ncbi:uncharacterized protein V1518DRAFT_412265 [Limtongia smithiae]|uniref:uncharacterized protein n=1 Tax=Limtongia smithiae TaxID=1125753 RepID=UPI0034CD6171
MVDDEAGQRWQQQQEQRDRRRARRPYRDKRDRDGHEQSTAAEAATHTRAFLGWGNLSSARISPVLTLLHLARSYILWLLALSAAAVHAASASSCSCIARLLPAPSPATPPPLTPPAARRAALALFVRPAPAHARETHDAVYIFRPPRLLAPAPPSPSPSAPAPSLALLLSHSPLLLNCSPTPQPASCLRRHPLFHPPAMDAPQYMSDPIDYESRSLSDRNLAASSYRSRSARTKQPAAQRRPSPDSSPPPMYAADSSVAPHLADSDLTGAQETSLLHMDEEDASSDISVLYQSTALLTPVSRRSNTSENLPSTPASTPLPSSERARRSRYARRNAAAISSPTKEDDESDREQESKLASSVAQLSFGDESDSNRSTVQTDLFKREHAYGSDDEMRDVSLLPDERPHPSACIFVASLSSSRPLDHLRLAVVAMFEQWGPLDVTVHRDNADRPYAFVQLRSFEDAREALESRRGQYIFDRPIRCEFARVNRSVFLASSKKTVTRREAETSFEKFGQLEFLISANVPYGRGLLRGWCAKFEYREDAIEAYFTLRPVKDLIVFYIQNPDPNIPASSENPSIFVRNLDPVKATSQLLHKKFDKYGRIRDIEIVNRASGADATESATALISYNHIEEARKAIVDANKTMFLERRVYLSFGNLMQIATTVKLAPAPKFADGERLESQNTPSTIRNAINYTPTSGVLASSTSLAGIAQGGPAGHSGFVPRSADLSRSESWPQTRALQSHAPVFGYDPQSVEVANAIANPYYGQYYMQMMSSNGYPHVPAEQFYPMVAYGGNTLAVSPAFQQAPLTTPPMDSHSPNLDGSLMYSAYYPYQVPHPNYVQNVTAEQAKSAETGKHGACGRDTSPGLSAPAEMTSVMTTTTSATPQVTSTMTAVMPFNQQPMVPGGAYTYTPQAYEMNGQIYYPVSYPHMASMTLATAYDAPAALQQQQSENSADVGYGSSNAYAKYETKDTPTIVKSGGSEH